MNEKYLDLGWTLPFKFFIGAAWHDRVIISFTANAFPKCTTIQQHYSKDRKSQSKGVLRENFSENFQQNILDKAQYL